MLRYSTYVAPSKPAGSDDLPPANGLRITHLIAAVTAHLQPLRLPVPTCGKRPNATASPSRLGTRSP